MKLRQNECFTERQDYIALVKDEISEKERRQEKKTEALVQKQLPVPHKSNRIKYVNSLTKNICIKCSLFQTASRENNLRS